MKQFLLALVLCVAALPAAAQPADLFISEYVEGSSNNKAIELYNGTGAAINLGTAGYRVSMYFNGNPVSTLTINLTGIVAPGDVFVLAQSGASAAVLAQADQTNGSGWYNGDDAVVLFRGATVVDAFGQAGTDPGAEWGTGLASTADNTLRRKADVCTGDTNPSDAFDPSERYVGFASDTFDGLGAHSATCGTPPPDNTPPAFTTVLADQAVPPGVPFTFTYAASDADGDALAFALTAAPAGADLGAASGTFTWTPSAGQAGQTFTVTATVSDGEATVSTTAQLSVASNAAPAFTSLLPDTLVDAGTALVFTYAAADADGDVPAFDLYQPPAGAQIHPANGTFTWTPAAPGVYTITASAGDGLSTTYVRTVVGVRGVLFPGQTGAALREALRAAYTPARTLGYDVARDTMYARIDLGPDGTVRCVYSAFGVTLPAGVDPSAYLASNGINAEHTWPQSMGAEEEPGRSDLHNLFPSKDNVNSARSNKPYAEIPDDQTRTWYRLGESTTTAPAAGRDLYSESTDGYFEPREVHKGNAARAALYFFTVYEALSDASFLLEQKQALVGWDALDPANGPEVRRTAEIAKRQGNVNPFLLDATLAARVVADVLPPAPSTLAEARTQADGTLVTVEGVVTRAGGRFARLQDATAGLTVFQSAGAFRAAVESGAVASGDRVRLTGTMDSFNGLRQIRPALFEVVSRGNALPAPAVVTLAEVAANGEAYESELIRVKGLRLDPAGDTTFRAAKTYGVQDASDATGSVDLRTPSAGEGAVIGTPVPPAAFSFVGVLGEFNGTYQLQPIDATDVRPDVAPPVIVLAEAERVVGPPNHKYHTVALDGLVASVSDEEDGALPVGAVVVTRVTSDEPEKGKGDGNTKDDIVVADGCRAVDVRAERQGGGNGRVYTLHLAVSDASGNVGEATFRVLVPQGSAPAVDDGPVYAVDGTCAAPAAARAAVAPEPLQAAQAAGVQAAPRAFALSAAYPNPFNPQTQFTLTVDVDQRVRVEVFDLLGRRVALLFDGSLAAGRVQALTFDAGRLPSGTYLLRATGEHFVRQQAVQLVK